MAKYDKIQVLTAIRETGIVPVFYNGDLERQFSANWLSTQTRSFPA